MKKQTVEAQALYIARCIGIEMKTYFKHDPLFVPSQAIRRMAEIIIKRSKEVNKSLPESH